MELTQTQAETLSYIRGLILRGKPWASDSAGVALGLTGHSADTRLAVLKRLGLVTTTRAWLGTRWGISITIEGFGTTVMPDDAFAAARVGRPRNWRAEEERLEAARIAVEQERMQRRTAHLMAERRPKQRTAAGIFDGAEAAIARAYGF